MTTKSQRGHNRWLYCEDGPLKGYGVTYSALPKVMVLWKEGYHDYERTTGNRYRHSAKCKCGDLLK
jgi:hypothetical protein